MFLAVGIGDNSNKAAKAQHRDTRRKTQKDSEILSLTPNPKPQYPEPRNRRPKILESFHPLN